MVNKSIYIHTGRTNNFLKVIVNQLIRIFNLSYFRGGGIQNENSISPLWQQKKLDEIRVIFQKPPDCGMGLQVIAVSTWK